MSASTAKAIENRPPAPMPWNARKAASIGIEVANELASDPRMKIEMANRNSGRLP
jgi:hypothetical protein